ncbi:MAG: hypothetical protein QM536_05430, partial [Chitinophagaceae bacterium]|nr:hypothetical protein [Chitinophagaceae bacterium]
HSTEILVEDVGGQKLPSFGGIGAGQKRKKTIYKKIKIPKKDFLDTLIQIDLGIYNYRCSNFIILIEKAK